VSPRKTIASYGPYGRRVRVFLEGERVVALWYVDGKDRQESWPHTRDGITAAKAWAKGFANRRDGVTSAHRPTTRELWDRYWAAEANHLRPRSQLRYRERWSWWERFVGRESIAEDVSIETAALFRRELERLGNATYQIRMILQVVRIAYNWGQRARAIRENPLTAYRFKVARDQPAQHEPAEYRREDFDRMVGALRAQWGTEWRASTALLVIGNQGTRQNAALHLQWADVDFLHGTLTWQGAYDKLGRTWHQPMRLETYAALLTARWWRARLGYAGPWVFPPARIRNPGPYTAQSLWHQQQRAERLAGVTHLELRAAHGLRRMVVNDILAATGGDLEAAAQFIGDRDLRVVRGGYRRTRDDAMAGLADRLDATAAAPPPEEPSPHGARVSRVPAGTTEEPPVGFEPTTARLRIESSTTELRWRDCTTTTYGVSREVYAVVPKLNPCSASTRAPNLAACCSTRYSTDSARWRTWPTCPYTFRTIVSPQCPIFRATV
jgi:integrase